LIFHLLDRTGQYLSNNFLDEDFAFYGKILGGKKEVKPRWQRVIDAAERVVGQALGQLFVQATFSAEAKAQALNMVQRLKSTLAEEITSLDWMGAQTKKNALAKLASMTEKIGYPDKWRDYSSLQIDRQSYVGNVMRGDQFEFNRQLAKIGKPVDHLDWSISKGTQSTAASYSDLLNEIVFPAGCLQPPIFDPQADDATNLGSMGAIIGHEITHGFDDEGSHYDAAGNLHDWWAGDDKKRFQERIDLIASQFDAYIVGGDTHLKGKLVSGEVAADLGGAIIALGALEKSLGDKARTKDANGFTPEQRFFISFAQMFAENSRPERDRLQAKTNEHPSAKLRVNGTLANMDAFAKAFNCGNDCPMMLPADRRCRLW
jgi:predicted metalloendopeptidase